MSREMCRPGHCLRCTLITWDCSTPSLFRVGRIFLLYTGQHYDPLVGAATPDTPTADETKVFPPGTELRDAALAIATAHNVEAAKRAKQKRVTRIKCDGCGELLADNAAFQEHCGMVEHDDDFCYTCTEVEAVIEEGEDLPEGSIDLTDESKYALLALGHETWLRCSACT